MYNTASSHSLFSALKLHHPTKHHSRIIAITCLTPQHQAAIIVYSLEIATQFTTFMYIYRHGGYSIVCRPSCLGLGPLQNIHMLSTEVPFVLWRCQHLFKVGTLLGFFCTPSKYSHAFIEVPFSKWKCQHPFKSLQQLSTSLLIVLYFVTLTMIKSWYNQPNLLLINSTNV